jgi:CubicO group peptidase (beta-lactamase class C family)
MLPWAEAIDSLAERSGFAGVVSVDRGGKIEFGKAYGLAHRAQQVPNTLDTRFAIASGTKGLTALTVVSLISDGALGLATAARSVLGRDLPLIGDDVTVEHLLAHRSGIGDYVDEEAGVQITDYVLTVPAQDLADTERYLAVLGGHPAKFPAGERFSYCNGGYVVLALIAERVSGVPFPRLVHERVCVAESTPPPPISPRSGGRCSPAGSCPPDGSPNWCAPAATSPRSRCATASASGSAGTTAR